eukprot:m.19308 g.19308  ORF g.19308 m.19308 type:complete len:807 (-) comp5917_c0_seq1:58-2478(-)
MAVALQLLALASLGAFALGNRTPDSTNLRGTWHVGDASSGIAVVVSAAGSYTLLVQGQPWFQSAPTRLHANGQWWSSSSVNELNSSGLLSLTASKHSTGADGAGQFSETLLTWQAKDADPTVTMQTRFRVYGNHTLVLEQVFPGGVNGTSLGLAEFESVLSEFPSLTVGTGTPEDAGFNQYSGRGVPGKPETCPHGRWPAPSLSGGWTNATGATAVFTESMSDTLVFSPSHDFSTTQQVYSCGNDGTPCSLKFGARASIVALPPGYRSGAVFHYGANGPTQTMISWGRFLLARAGKPHDTWRADMSLNTLGYTTDNGAFYYYNTLPGKNYQDTILAVHSDATSHNIPFRWVLYDSWFYKKSGSGGHAQDPAHGVVNWTEADPAVFPSGLAYMYKHTGWPVVAHNRAWSKDNVYAKQNGGDFEFLMSKDLTGETIALPLHLEFWDYLFGHVKTWGCLSNQQDWMFTQQGMEGVLQSATLQTAWQVQMSQALVSHDMHFGFGGSSPDNWLQSVEMLAVTNGRATDDYHASLNDQWQLGVVSTFVWALGLIPAKDGWWSTAVQPGHPYKDNRTEPYSALHAAVSVLSRGPVTPADKVGLMNETLIMRTCTAQGDLLQGDRPALALDAQLAQLAFGPGHGVDGQLWATYTVISGFAYHHVLAATIAQPYVLDIRTLPRPPNGQVGNRSFVVENGVGVPVMASLHSTDDAGLAVPVCGRADFRLYHTAPVMTNGWAVLGELAKFVPVSATRIRQIIQNAEDMIVRVAGSAGEAIAFSFAHETGGGKIVTVSCEFGDLGTLTITSNGQCTEE